MNSSLSCSPAPSLPTAPTSLRRLAARFRKSSTALISNSPKSPSEFQFKVNKPVEDEEHHTWSICFTDAQGATRCIDWTLASSPEFRQMMAKYSQIKEYLEPPFLIEFAAKGAAETATEEPEGTEYEEGEAPAAVKAEAKAGTPRLRAFPREPVEKQTARELFAYIVEQGKKDYQVQRYKGLGEMTSSQLWETTMDPERRTLLSGQARRHRRNREHLHHPHGRRRRSAPQVH